MGKQLFYRKTESGLLVASIEEREYPRTPNSAGCCSKHWLPAGCICEDYTPDNGGGILIQHCSNCWYYNDRQLKYNKLLHLNKKAGQ
jgi:hypothetical protein